MTTTQPRMCDACGVSQGTMICTRCRFACYCSVACQKVVYREHKEECLAQAALNAHDWAAAVSHLNRAIPQQPSTKKLALLNAKRAQAYLGMAESLAGSKDPQIFQVLAQKDANTSLELEPEQVEGYLHLSKSLVLLQDDLESAESTIRRGLLVQPPGKAPDDRLVEQLQVVEKARAAAPDPNNVKLKLVYDSPNKYGFGYTIGLYNQRRPEYLLIDIPDNLIHRAQAMLSFVTLEIEPSTLQHGDLIAFPQPDLNDVRLQAFYVAEEAHRAACVYMAGSLKTCTEVIVLRLLLGDEEPEDPERTTIELPVTRHRSNLLESILDKWKAQMETSLLPQCFSKYISLETRHKHHSYNTMEIPFNSFLELGPKKDIFWDQNLTRKEAQFVRNHWEIVRLHARVQILCAGESFADGPTIRAVARQAQMGSVHVGYLYRRGFKLVGP